LSNNIVPVDCLAAAAGRDVDFAPLVARYTTLWSMPSLAQTTSIQFSSRLRRSWGRTNLQRRSITLAAELEQDRSLLEVVLCHELAHLAAYELAGRSERPHGPTWQRLVREAGQEPVVQLIDAQAAPPTSSRPTAPRRFLHRCLVCDFSRSSRKPIPAWRCADCVAAGLDGRLSMTEERSTTE
jgi:predicted SprT family Zn-dependent metalloprotease